MKLVFRKNDQEEITVLQSCDGDEHAFTYTGMIKALLKDGELEVSVLDGTFTEEEQRSINNMVNEINRETKDAMKASGGTEEPNDSPTP
ncbi:MAG: hypothetical protein VB050_10805 [Geobacteraceae bacterium]|nr:hypothetical protein [Geobacteraceae bacterium]